MRLIVIGCEYTGKSTLIDAIDAWGKARGIQFHLDDHFSIPDYYHLEESDRRAMAALPPTLKERFQRFQIYYHIHIAHNHEDCLLGGFYSEEVVYGPRYYYPGQPAPNYARRVESELPPDTILLLLTASPDVIRRRMRENPHPIPVVQDADVEAVSSAFAQEYRESWIDRKFTIDTSALTPAALVAEFMRRLPLYLDTRDLLRFGLTSPT